MSRFSSTRDWLVDVTSKTASSASKMTAAAASATAAAAATAAKGVLTTTSAALAPAPAPWSPVLHGAGAPELPDERSLATLRELHALAQGSLATDDSRADLERLWCVFSLLCLSYTRGERGRRTASPAPMERRAALWKETLGFDAEDPLEDLAAGASSSRDGP